MTTVVFDPCNQEISSDILGYTGQILRDLGHTTIYRNIYDNVAEDPMSGDLKISMNCYADNFGKVTVHCGPEYLQIGEDICDNIQAITKYPVILREQDGEDRLRITAFFIDIDINTPRFSGRVKRNFGQAIANAAAEYTIPAVDETAEEYCHICGAGPFKNLQLHITRVHG